MLWVHAGAEWGIMWDFEEPAYDQPEGNGNGEARKPIEWAVFAPSLNDRSRLSASKRYTVYRPFLPLINSHHACDSRDISLLSLWSPSLCHLVILWRLLSERFFYKCYHRLLCLWMRRVPWVPIRNAHPCQLVLLLCALSFKHDRKIYEVSLKVCENMPFFINKLPAHCLKHFWFLVDVMNNVR